MAIKILAVSGALRAASSNTALLRAAQELAPEGVEIEIYDGIAELPFFDQDLEAEPPPSVVRWREAVAAADGVLLATPEYNYSTSGVLKNAIDWASRPPEQPFDGKAIGIMGASAGVFGTGRAQYHLRQCFVFLNGFVMNRPEVMIPAAQNKFDASGKLTDQATRDFMSAHLAAFKAWVLRMK
jgi:chromate reductase, NAD(P)H dehydrogenase (quinone)